MMVKYHHYVTAEILSGGRNEKFLTSFRTFGSDLGMAGHSCHSCWDAPGAVSFDAGVWWPRGVAPFFTPHEYETFCPVFRGDVMVGVILDFGG